MDLDVTSSERLLTGVVSDARDQDPVGIVHTGLTGIREVYTVFVHTRTVYCCLAEETRLGAVIAADDSLHVDRMYGHRLQRSVILILLLPTGDPRKRDLGIPAERAHVAIERTDP